jgi:hypothetical protein
MIVERQIAMSVIHYSEHHYEQISVEQLKPKVVKNALYFPLSVTFDSVEEDGLSFGHPIDSGKYWTANYERAVGVLAEDTIAMIESLKRSKPKARFNLLDFVEFRNVEGWSDGFDLNDEDSYHSWPHEVRQAYDKAHSLDNLESATLLIEYQDAALYLVDGMLWGNLGEHWNHNKITPLSFVDDCDIETLKSLINIRKETVLAYNQKMKEVNENITSLSTIFGYKAA